MSFEVEICINQITFERRQEEKKKVPPPNVLSNLNKSLYIFLLNSGKHIEETKKNKFVFTWRTYLLI